MGRRLVGERKGWEEERLGRGKVGEGKGGRSVRGKVGEREGKKRDVDSTFLSIGRIYKGTSDLSLLFFQKVHTND